MSSRMSVGLGRLLSRRAALIAALGLVAAPARAQQSVVDELHGVLRSETFPAFERFVSKRLDRVIGLKISAEPEDSADISIGASDGQFVAYAASGQSEIVANGGFTWQHGAYAFDGFFIVKSGGMHQGIISYDLEPVAEALIRLNRGLTIRRINLD